MYWSLVQESPERGADGFEPEGRFVLHRHRDDHGPHYDLRIEDGGCLLGWRIDGASLEGRPWATEKAPHPLGWLDCDGDATREDDGVYAWAERSPDGRTLVLHGRRGDRVMRFAREAALPPGVVREVRCALDEAGADPLDAARLIADGLTARRRALERFCGLGRELDGDAFEETAWRKALESLSLEELHAQLRAYEVRFDLKYPPQPVSRPEPLLEEAAGGARAEAVLEILRAGDSY